MNSLKIMHGLVRPAMARSCLRHALALSVSTALALGTPAFAETDIDQRAASPAAVRLATKRIDDRLNRLDDQRAELTAALRAMQAEALANRQIMLTLLAGRDKVDAAGAAERTTAAADAAKGVTGGQVADQAREAGAALRAVVDKAKDGTSTDKDVDAARKKAEDATAKIDALIEKKRKALEDSIAKCAKASERDALTKMIQAPLAQFAFGEPGKGMEALLESGKTAIGQCGKEVEDAMRDFGEARSVEEALAQQVTVAASALMFTNPIAAAALMVLAMLFSGAGQGKGEGNGKKDGRDADGDAVETVRNGGSEEKPIGDNTQNGTTTDKVDPKFTTSKGSCSLTKADQILTAKMDGKTDLTFNIAVLTSSSNLPKFDWPPATDIFKSVSCDFENRQLVITKESVAGCFYLVAGGEVEKMDEATGAPTGEYETRVQNTEHHIEADTAKC